LRSVRSPAGSTTAVSRPTASYSKCVVVESGGLPGPPPAVVRVMLSMLPSRLHEIVSTFVMSSLMLKSRRPAWYSYV
jgi:hypothetical protein